MIQVRGYHKNGATEGERDEDERSESLGILLICTYATEFQCCDRADNWISDAALGASKPTKVDAGLIHATRASCG